MSDRRGVLLCVVCSVADVLYVELSVFICLLCCVICRWCVLAVFSEFAV